MNKKAQGKRNRTKGLQFERDIAKAFNECGWPKAARNLRESQMHHAIRKQDLEGTAPFAVQCKCETKPSNSDDTLLRSVQIDVKAGIFYPVIVRREPRKAATVSIFVEDLAAILIGLQAENQKLIPTEDILLPKVIDGSIVVMSLDHFKQILIALRKAGMYPKKRA